MGRVDANELREALLNAKRMFPERKAGLQTAIDLLDNCENFEEPLAYAYCLVDKSNNIHYAETRMHSWIYRAKGYAERQLKTDIDGELDDCDVVRVAVVPLERYESDD